MLVASADVQIGSLAFFFCCEPSLRQFGTFLLAAFVSFQNSLRAGSVVGWMMVSFHDSNQAVMRFVPVCLQGSVGSSEYVNAGVRNFQIHA